MKNKEGLKMDKLSLLGVWKGGKLVFPQIFKVVHSVTKLTDSVLVENKTKSKVFSLERL